MRWSILLLAVAVCCGPLLHAAVATAATSAEPVGRDAALWPFAASSPWNSAVGDQAVFQPITSPRFAVKKGGILNSTGFSHPVFIAEPADPEVSIFKKGSGSAFAVVRVPLLAQPDAQGDGHLHIIDEQRRNVIEMWQAVRNADGSITAVAVVKNDLTDDGVYGSWHGVRAYGGSAIAGLIRSGELTGGIRHALAIAVEQQALNRNGPGGRGYVWPASSCDNKNSYSASGNLFMGSLLAIPPTVDVHKLGLGPQALEVAIAAQDYGAYITDCTGTNLSFYAEPAASEEVALTTRGELSQVVALLQVVSNNTVQSVGGGGLPRRPPAPPFVPPGQLVRAGGLPPVISEASPDTTVEAGQPLHLTVTASGGEPLAYRWKRSGLVLNVITPVFDLAAVQPGDAGIYTCTVSNQAGRTVVARMLVVVGGGAVAASMSTQPDAVVLAAWGKRLRTAVRASLVARRAPRFRAELFHAQATVQELAADDTLTIAVTDAGSLQLAWDKLRPSELCGLALDVTCTDQTEGHALAAFYLLLAGDTKAARGHLDFAGASAAGIAQAFGGPQ